MTCQHCGADAVDASGVCRACGWRVGSTAAQSQTSADSLAETREADIPLPARRVSAAARTTGPATPPVRHGATMPPAPRGVSGAYGGAAPASKRFCGSCGAEIEPGQQFCGQCGTPVAGYEALGNPPTLAHRGTYPPMPYDQEREVWSPADQDAPTEQFVPPYRYPSNAPFRQSGAYGSTVGAAGGLTRETRVLLGILCILGALISGVAAIVLTFVH